VKNSPYQSYARAGLAFLAIALCGVAFAAPGSAWASEISIVPIGLSLSPSKATDLITLHNAGATAASLELSAYRWDQTPDGRIKLTPSEDVVFFPPIVTVGGKEDRIVRVGAMIPFGLTEKTYRLIAEEMPPPHFQPLPAGAPKRVETRVVVLTRVSIPIFLTPPSIVHQEALDGLAVQNGRVVFQVKNGGNEHVLIGSAKITGLTSDNRAVFSKTTRGGNYLLSGEPTQTAIDLPNPPCNQLRKIALEVPITEPFGELDLRSNMLKAEIPVSPANCGPERGPRAAANGP